MANACLFTIFVKVQWKAKSQRTEDNGVHVEGEETVLWHGMAGYGEKTDRIFTQINIVKKN